MRRRSNRLIGLGTVEDESDEWDSLSPRQRRHFSTARDFMEAKKDYDNLRRQLRTMASREDDAWAQAGKKGNAPASPERRRLRTAAEAARVREMLLASKFSEQYGRPAPGYRRVRPDRDEEEFDLNGLAALKARKTGPMDATLANGEKLSLFYHRESRLWVLQLLDKDQNQIGPGYGETAEYIHSREEAGAEFDKLANERGGIKKRGLDGLAANGQRGGSALPLATLALVGLAGFALWKLLSSGESETGERETVGTGPCRDIDSQLATPIGCGTANVTGYVGGKGSPIVVREIPGEPGYYLQSSPVNVYGAFLRLRDAAVRAGHAVTVNSAFRTMAKQSALYADYTAGTGNKAARPGYSTHQNGFAVDLEVKRGGLLTWLRANANAYGFFETVLGEDWHWAYDPSRDRYARTA